MKTNWTYDKISVKEIVKHLKDFHCVPFKKSTLTETQFISEHFGLNLNKPSFTKNEIAEIKSIQYLLKASLKFCEKHNIAIIRAIDLNNKGNYEWRICKPNQEQVDSLKHARWFAGAEGLFNKAALQQAMVNDEVDINSLLSELRDQVSFRQDERERARELEAEEEAKQIAEETKKSVKARQKENKVGIKSRVIKRRSFRRW